MCHLILILPIIALPMFWLIPLPMATLLYAIVVAFSVWVYFKLMQSMHRPVNTGKEGLLHASGEVLRIDHGHLLVRIAGEIWQADSDERLRPGDPIDVVGLNGLRLSVKRHAYPRASTIQ